ncbi:cilia- and flagella-associated protein 157-like [Cottoperca gobio]|uniref:Cilia- and flagella-associated protein 157 n=1 Tax=Cottoperca gobio TaxID=56716 RepID=A0A6J2QC37_COTGO|nr:cilia- and flagella-associated protein 157-like [Cottoperca gobio]
MPRKKEKKSVEKQNEIKKTQKKESSASPVDNTGWEGKENELYLIQIRYLNEQLERYQLKCDQLEMQKKDLHSQYSVLEKEKKDIVEYLKRSLLEKEDEMDELTERIGSQQQDADKDRDARQLQHNQLRQELQGRIEEVTSENTTLAVRLASLEEFQKQREQLMSNMESLEKQLASQKEEYKAAIHSLEMKALLENKRLEKEMENHVAAMEAEVHHLVDQKVPETTRLALQENTEVKTRISQLSEETHVLMEENSVLRDRKSRLSVDVDILEQMLSETSRKSCVRKKVVEQLTGKCEQLLAELKDCKRELEQLQTKHTGVLAEMEALRSIVVSSDRTWASLSKQCSKSRAEVSRLEAELLEERRRRSRMKRIMQEAAVALRQALMDAPTDQDSVVQWRQLMEKLMVVLDRPTLTNATTETEQHTSDPAAAREASLNPASSFQFELARYRPGDLGLVPRPTPKHKHILSRPGAAGSGSSHVPLHRKPSSQKTDSASNRTGSAVRLSTCRNSFTKPKNM